MKKLIKKLTNHDKINKLEKELSASLNKIDYLTNKIDYLSNKINNYEQRINSLDKQNKTLLRDIERNIKNVEKIVSQNSKSLNNESRDPKIIVSMTSFPARIHYVHTSLERLFLQTLRPDKVVLYLSKDQFPNLEFDLPYQLLEYKKLGLEIEWCDGDIKAYKKVLPPLKQYSNDIIIIVDDDLIYDVDMVENLYSAHLIYPHAIIASRVHKPLRDEEGNFLTYRNWDMECDYDKYQCKHDWFFTGGAGTLIPPHIYDEELFNEDVIQKLCPHADDIWLNIHTAIKQIPIVNIAKNHLITKVNEAQVTMLYDINRNENDVQLEALRNHYKDQLENTIYQKY